MAHPLIQVQTNLASSWFGVKTAANCKGIFLLRSRRRGMDPILSSDPILPQVTTSLYFTRSFASSPPSAALGTLIGVVISTKTMVKVNLPDGTQLKFEDSVTILDVAASIGPGLAKAAVAGEVDGRVVGLDFGLPQNDEVSLRILTIKDPAALAVMRHSCAHVMARAVMRLFEGVQLAFGPTIEGGFYYDFQLEHSLTEDDFPTIEAEMKEIIQQNEPFERIEQPRDTALKVCRDLEQVLKVEHIQDGLAAHDTLSFYRQGEFIDLCRGPHIPKPKLIGAYKTAVGGGCVLEGRCLATAIATAVCDSLF